MVWGLSFFFGGFEGLLYRFWCQGCFEGLGVQGFGV